MKDINGIEIKIGDTVKTTQPSGGILNPTPSEIGRVVEYKLSYQEKTVLAIKYQKQNTCFNRYILLEGKINEVL